MEFTREEKKQLTGINENIMYEKIKKELYTDLGETISKEQFMDIENLWLDSVDIEIDYEEILENVKATYKTLDDQIVVIKMKKLNLERLFRLLTDSVGLLSKNNFYQILCVIQMLSEMFVTKLDEESAGVYIYLAYYCIGKHERYNNEEVFEKLMQYSKETYGVRWTTKKIRKILNVLENEVDVIEFQDGYLYVKDKITQI